MRRSVQFDNLRATPEADKMLRPMVALLNELSPETKLNLPPADPRYKKFRSGICRRCGITFSWPGTHRQMWYCELCVKTR